MTSGAGSRVRWKAATTTSPERRKAVPGEGVLADQERRHSGGGTLRLEEITFENDDLAECDESEQVQSESSACWELRQIIRDAPFPLKDQNDAAEELERLAEQSDLHAQYLMGLLYRDGLLLIPDSQSAKYWLTQAAKQGLPEAQYALDKLLSLTILKSVIRTGASAA